MSFSMAGGPYSYNRFSQFNKLVEGAKPDFLDMDKDGNKKESFKKAVKDKEKGVKEGCECDDKKKSKKDMKEYRDPVSYALESDKKLMNLHGGDKKMTSKKKVTKEDVMQHLMDEGFVSNEVSAEVLFNHMSDDWLISLETAIEEAYQTMSAKATNMSKRRSADLADQEYKAAKSGDSAKTNQIMQKKIKVMDTRSRHGKPGMR